MRKSVVAPSLELKEKLLEVGVLVDNFQNKKSSAVVDWLLWLKNTEEILKKYNYSETADLAGLRAAILATGNNSESRRSGKKAQIQKALETINSAQQVVLVKQSQLEERIEKVRTIIRQVVTLAKTAGLIKLRPGENFTAFLEQFLMQMQQHEQLQPSINMAIATVGKYDTLRILAEEIEFS